MAHKSGSFPLKKKKKMGKGLGLVIRFAAAHAQREGFSLLLLSLDEGFVLKVCLSLRF
jgi:hypothetical protein